MTPALLARLQAATATIEARYGKPVKPPSAAQINANDTFIVSASAPLILEQGDVKLVLSQVAVGAGLHGIADPADIEVRMIAADAIAFCDAVAAGGDAVCHHNSAVIKVASDILTVGVGPGYVGDGSGNLDYGVVVYGPVALTPTARVNLVAAIRAIIL
jgi:hypothetical protein